MNELFNLKIGSNKKKVKIINIDAKASIDGNPNKRFYVYTQSDDGAEYKVNEVWVKDHTGTLAVKGLWLNYDSTGENLLATSLLAKFLQYLNVNSVAEVIGKEVTLQPKPNGFMAIVAYDENTP
jgi:hypothetical protein